jgi:phage tail-like protein
MEPFYPPRNFHFSVTVIGAGAGSQQPDADASFQEIAGMQARMEVETVVEGGENRFAYRLPRYVNYSNLVLKRGLVPNGSALTRWAAEALGGGLALPIETKDLKISLLNDKGTPMASWTFQRTYPLRWELAAFNSKGSEVLIETLELAYNYFFRNRD